MERVACEWFTRGRGETLLGWAEELPAATRSRAPWVALYQSRVLTDRHEYDEANAALAHAETGCSAAGDTACLSRIHSQRATIAALQGEYEDTIREAQLALDLLDPEATLERAAAHRWTGRALIGLGRTDEGIAKLRIALTMFREASSPYDVVNVLQDLTLGFTAQGRFDEVVVGMNEALAISRRLGAAGQLAGVLNNLATLHSVRGEYQEALALYEEGLAAATVEGDPGGQSYHLIGMADINRDIGAFERAESLYEAAWRLAQATEPRVAVYTLAAQADMYRWRGQLSRAASLVERARWIAEDTDLVFERRGLIPLAEGILLSESGDVDEGLAMLAEASRYFKGVDAKEYLARARLLVAKAALIAGREAMATGALHEVAALAEQIGTIHFAVVEGQHSDDLVEFCQTSGMPGCSEIADRISSLRSFSATLAQVGDQRSDGQTSRLEIFALGEGRVVRDGRLLTTSDWQAAMSKEMFFYILMNGPLERDAIGLEFWPDSSRKKMSNSFHSTLYRVRRAVGQNVIVVEDGYYRVAELSYWFDVDEFVRAVERARLLPPTDPQADRLWGQAVSLYQGELLPEVDRMWCVSTRERLGEMYLESLAGLGRCADARGTPDQAIEWYERALGVDELREDIHRSIMRSYVRAGMRSKAIERFERCCEVIDRELGVGVSEETLRLADGIRSGRVT
jgi:DNA-binding SARP family transcriptional activator